MFCLTKFSCEKVDGISYFVNSLLGDCYRYNLDGLVEVPPFHWLVPINYLDPHLCMVNLLKCNVRINYKLTEESIKLMASKGMIRYGRFKLNSELKKLVARIVINSKEVPEKELEQMLRYYFQSIKGNLTSVSITV